MVDHVDVVVIGAGVVGLAAARELALAGREVLVLERHGSFGEETSSRNSEVIHAGIYYPKGSLKAQCCVQGKRLLYEYCQARQLPHHRCGKIIVATTREQARTLGEYQHAAAANGVTDLQPLDKQELQQLEPAVSAHSGLLSPSTGIIDSHAYMVSLLGDLEAAGGLVAFQTEVQQLQSSGEGLLVTTDDMELQANWVINSAGLQAVALARRVTSHCPASFFAIGHYYTYSGASPFQRLVYPLPQAGGLGVHVTLDMGGGVKFGPDVRWQSEVDYAFDDSQRHAFIAAIAAYFPAVEIERLQPGYTGVRPKISGPDDAAADFRIDGPAAHGTPGLVNLFGIESPGLTASLALAQRVKQIVAQGVQA